MLNPSKTFKDMFKGNGKEFENVVISEFVQSWSFMEAGNSNGKETSNFNVSIPFTENLLVESNAISSGVSSVLPATPARRTFIHPVISAMQHSYKLNEK